MFSLFTLLAGGSSLLLAGCDAFKESWQEYTGPETKGEEVNSFYHRTAGHKTCFVGRITAMSMTGTYAGHYNRATDEVHMYAHAPQLKMLMGSTGVEATDIKVASVNQPEGPGDLATLMLTDSPVADKMGNKMVPTSTTNLFTDDDCWNGGKGVPKSLKNTVKEEF